jgi:anaerobic magnesium-protoporphyrin IX monomethyl ester cyclase
MDIENVIASKPGVQDEHEVLKNSDGSAPRVILIRPPQKFYNAKFPRGPRVGLPNGIIAIGSFLERRGCEVLIHDALVEKGFPDGTLPDTVELFGSSWDEIRRVTEDFSPDIVGITNIFQETMDESLQTAKEIRSILPECTIIVGGPNATSHADHIATNCSDIDFVCIGDGEDTMFEAVEYAVGQRNRDDISGIAYFDDGKVVRAKNRVLPLDLDPLGASNYNLVDLEKYFSLERQGIMARGRFHHEEAERSVSIMTSRGCPYTCVFCSIHIHAGRKYRVFSPQAVVDQIENLVVNFGVKHIHFEDDNLTLDHDRFMAIMDGVLEKGLKFSWDTPNGVHANTLTREMMIKMKKTGCAYLIIAVESGDQHVIDKIIKKNPMKISNVIHAFEVGRDIGLDLQAFYIIGFPGETMENIYTTLDFAYKGLNDYGVIPHVATARADKGTELFETAESNGHLLENKDINNPQGVHIDRFVRHVITTKEFSAEQLEALNHRYHKKYMRSVGIRSFLYSVSNPIISSRNVGYLLHYLSKMKLSFRESVYMLFFTRLFYPNAMKKEKEFLS